MYKKYAHRAIFQSTLPLWGATGLGIGGDFIPGISIHAPLVGSDLGGHAVMSCKLISIHAPLVGSDNISGAG